ncbi:MULTISPECIES: nuclear transport factor 2 family protein [unclassified Nocardiopsis]|uniref:nuclear transport factor 2 family protein n=1 Tax=unclassified Nocardiopsis TaxID=2649073 RepID=UPI0033C6FDC2
MAYPAEPPPEAALSARVPDIGREHIHLSYAYLDRRDSEGLASLVDPGARFHGPRARVARGPQEATELLLRLVSEGSAHTLHRIVVEHDGAAVSGALTTPEGKRVDFADFLSISDHGLLLSWRRFHSVEW